MIWSEQILCAPSVRFNNQFRQNKMNVQVENLDTHEARLTVDIEPSVIEQTRREVAKNLSKAVRVPGFRPGMAPMSVVINAIGGEAVFAEEVNEALAKKVYPLALDEAKVNPYSAGIVEKITTDPPQMVARVPLEPTIDLKDYKSIRVPYPEVSVTSDEIEHEFEHIREDNAIIQLAERPAQMGDAVEATIVGEVNGETVLRQNSRERIVMDAERMNIPGLVEALVGMSAGEHKHVHITLPADFDREELRNLEMHTEIDMTRVNSRQLPEIGDELAQTVGAYQTLAELRADIEKRLLAYKEQENREKYANNALDTFAGLANISYPAAFIEDRLNDAMDEYKGDIRRMGLPFEDWLNISKKTEADYREEFKPNTEMRARRGLVMRQLAVDENLKVSDDEVNAEFERERDLARQNRGDLKKDKETLANIRNNVLSNKVIDRMVAIAKGEG